MTPGETSAAVKPAVVELGAACGDDPSFPERAERLGFGRPQGPVQRLAPARSGAAPDDVARLAAAERRTEFLAGRAYAVLDHRERPELGELLDVSSWRS